MFHNEVFLKMSEFWNAPVKETLKIYVFFLHINYSLLLPVADTGRSHGAAPLSPAPHCHSLRVVSKLQLVQNKTNPLFLCCQRITHPRQPPWLHTRAPRCHHHRSWSPAWGLAPSTQRQRKGADSFWSGLPATHLLLERYIPCLISDP